MSHYSIHTERTYCEWIRRFILFHGMKSRVDLNGGEKKIEAFHTHLAVHANVCTSTQNQAMNVLVFLYRKVLKQDLGEEKSAVRAVKSAVTMICTHVLQQNGQGVLSPLDDLDG